MPSLGWYLQRLRVMRPRDLLHRARIGLADRALRRASRRGLRSSVAADWRAYGFCRADRPVLPELALEFAPDQLECEDWLRGRWTLLGHDWQWTPEAAAWHQAPDSGLFWPQQFFGAIDHRPGNRYGDVRIAWEPARMQQLMDLALLARSRPGNAPAATRLLEDILDSWVLHNPFPFGIHYLSSMECGLRLLATCHALDLAREQLSTPQRTWSNLLSIVATHAPFIARRMSLHSSAGNHTIAEGAGLVYAGLLFPEMPDAARWLSTGMAALGREAGRQVLPDGGGLEQALTYHLFVIDLLGLVQQLVAAAGREVPATILDAVTRGSTFLATLAPTPSALPPIGDSDGGSALIRQLRISFPQPTQPAPPLLTLPTSGYSIVTTRSPKPTRLIFDHGPLGMAPLYGHGHADALAVLLDVDGLPLFIDSGTYAYGLVADLRRYFRSTRAHNTVVVDGLDQAAQCGAFMWSSPFDARLLSSGAPAQTGGARLLGVQDGYRPRCGVRHFRGVRVTGEGAVLIWDRLVGEGQHDLELNWHLADDSLIERSAADTFRVRAGLQLALRGGEIATHCGGIDPLIGWASSTYGRRRPISTVQLRHAGALPHEFTTVLSPPGADESWVVAELEYLRKAVTCHCAE